MSTPQSMINVCSGVALNNSYTHTIYFEDKIKQQTYFRGKVVKSFTSYTYLRRNWDIKVECNISTAQLWNYLYFINDNKTYFYFITSVEYKSETTSVLHLELDVMQTYMFDWDLKPCFIERMTPASDEIGENTIDEGLELGELIDYDTTKLMDYSNYALIVMSTVNLTHYKMVDGKPYFPDAIGIFVSDMYSGCGLYSCSINDYIAEVNQLMVKLSEAGKLDGIISMWLYPKLLIEVQEQDFTSQGYVNTPFHVVKDDLRRDFNILKTDKTLGEYTPVNNKLLTYPYRMIHIYNNMGVCADYHIERFNPDLISADFQVQGSVLPDGGMRVVPVEYNGQSYNYEHALTIPAFPTCAWSGDAYKIWLAQNQHQQNVSYGMSGVSSVAGVGMMIAGALTANPVLATSGAVSTYSGITQISQLLAQNKDMQSLPNQARGVQSASVNASQKTLTFTISFRCVSPERARIIDDFFTMYGYKQLCVDTPSIHNRSLFTYIKTKGCYVCGEICNEDKQKIASVFDNGVTFWTNGDKIGNYNETNGFL